MESEPATTRITKASPFPHQEQLIKAAAFHVLGPDGSSRPFSSLYDDVEDRAMVIFIRHFYCGDCQDYVRALSESITPQELKATGRSLRIVGCGDHTVIPNYATETGCPFEIFSDSTGLLYELLGMESNLDRGREPSYIKRSLPSGILTGIWQMIKWGMPLKGGYFKQLGGEWMWVKGELVWCHRMQNTRDHPEVSEIREILALG